jgi:hypothetical protein
MVDSRIKTVHAGKSGTDPEQQALMDQYVASLGPDGLDELLDGACTLIYMFMTWLRKAHESEDKDVIEYVVPTLVATMRMMPRSCPPEVIPTMAALTVAAGTGLSPSLWRQQYGDWSDVEMTALEATAFLLAEHINRIADDPDFATRMIVDALTNVRGGGEG